MKDTLEEVRENYGASSPQYIGARFLRLRHYRAETIADFLEHRGETDNSSYFAIIGPFLSSGNPFNAGSHTNIVLVTLGWPCLYEETHGINKHLSSPGMRIVAQYTTFWVYCSEDEEPPLDMTPNAEISDRTGTLKVISGLDSPCGRSIYSPTIAYNRKSGVIQLLNGFSPRGNHRERERRREIGGLELAAKWA